jgi:hypothetical protein
VGPFPSFPSSRYILRLDLLYPSRRAGSCMMLSLLRSPCQTLSGRFPLRASCFQPYRRASSPPLFHRRFRAHRDWRAPRTEVDWRPSHSALTPPRGHDRARDRRSRQTAPISTTHEKEKKDIVPGRGGDLGRESVRLGPWSSTQQFHIPISPCPHPHICPMRPVIGPFASVWHVFWIAPSRGDLSPYL